MSASDFDAVCRLLLKLESSQLAEVKARAGLLLQSGGASRSTASAQAASPIQQAKEETDAALVLSEIAAHLLSEGIEYASIPQLQRMQNYRSFAAKIPATMEYFRRITTNRVKLRALIRIAIKLLYKDLARMNISASTRTLMNHWHRVPAVINRSFPGYAKIGMLGVLVNSGAIDPEYVLEVTEKRE